MSVSAAAGRTRPYQVAVVNRGNVADRFVLLADHTHPGFRARFLSRSTDVTDGILAGTYRSPVLDPGERFTLTVRAATGPGQGGDRSRSPSADADHQPFGR